VIRETARHLRVREAEFVMREKEKEFVRERVREIENAGWSDKKVSISISRTLSHELSLTN